MTDRPPLDVFITVDVEVSLPFGDRWRETGLSAELRRDIDGWSTRGDLGVGFHMAQAEAHGLKVSFFVEALSPLVVGLAPLARMVNPILERGHEVQLHLHPEWLSRLSPPGLQGQTGAMLTGFTEAARRELVQLGADHLRAVGVPGLCAFRAGNFGADERCLPAIAAAGLSIDTSYSVMTARPAGWPSLESTLFQARPLGGVVEVPVSCFRDVGAHLRHVQLCACSFDEIRHALVQAAERGWKSFVIVSHSFEFIRRSRDPMVPSVANWIAARRFVRLCQYLGANRDRFRVGLFRDTSPRDLVCDAAAPLHSSVARTALRYVEQGADRVVSMVQRQRGARR